MLTQMTSEVIIENNTTVKLGPTKANLEQQRQLQDTRFQISNAVVKLKHISGIPGDTDTVDEGEWRGIDLAKGIPFACKVGVTERRPPMTLEFMYTSGDQLQFFGAFKSETPNHRTAEHKKQGMPKKIVVNSPAKNSFNFGEFEHYFIKMQSDIPMKFQIRVTFPIVLKEVKEAQEELNLEYLKSIKPIAQMAQEITH